MKINVRQQLLDYNGKPIVEGDNQTFRDFLSFALTAATRDEIFTGEQKALSHQIEKKLYSANEVSFTESERSYAKDRALKILPVVHAGRIVDILENVEAMPILSEKDLGPEPAPAENKPEPAK